MSILKMLRHGVSVLRIEFPSFTTGHQHENVEYDDDAREIVNWGRVISDVTTTKLPGYV